jgi:hypothetical protein
MRILAFAILAIGTVSIGPAAAQMYDPAYPVCLHVWGAWGANYYDCRYTWRHRAARLGAYQSVFCGHASACGRILSPCLPKSFPGPALKSRASGDPRAGLSSPPAPFLSASIGGIMAHASPDPPTRS